VVVDPTTTLQVIDALNDGHFSSSGTFYDGNNRLVVGCDGTYNFSNYVRFTGVAVPHTAVITTAKIQYCSYTSLASVPCSTVIYGNAADNAAIPASYADYIAKVQTTASVTWSLQEWSVGIWYDSPDISSIVQEIVSRSGWVSGNALMILHKGNGANAAYRQPYAYEGGPTYAPKLVIEYSTGTTYTGAGTLTGSADASAGGTRIAMGVATLDGAATEQAVGNIVTIPPSGTLTGAATASAVGTVVRKGAAVLAGSTLAMAASTRIQRAVAEANGNYLLTAVGKRLQAPDDCANGILPVTFTARADALYFSVQLNDITFKR
jgi:hypothetical protein